MPKTPSQEVFGCLGEVSSHMNWLDLFRVGDTEDLQFLSGRSLPSISEFSLWGDKQQHPLRRPEIKEAFQGFEIIIRLEVLVHMCLKRELKFRC